MKKPYGLNVVVKITEMRDNAIFSTAEIEEIWVPINMTTDEKNAWARRHGGDFLGSVSTQRMEELGYNTVRMIEKCLGCEEPARDGRFYCDQCN